jgi:hypothetical protein
MRISHLAPPSISWLAPSTADPEQSLHPREQLLLLELLLLELLLLELPQASPLLS